MTNACIGGRPPATAAIGRQLPESSHYCTTVTCELYAGRSQQNRMPRELRGLKSVCPHWSGQRPINGTLRRWPPPATRRKAPTVDQSVPEMPVLREKPSFSRRCSRATLWTPSPSPPSISSHPSVTASPRSDSDHQATTVPCDSPHNAEVVSVVDLEVITPDWPGTRAVAQITEDSASAPPNRCSTAATGSPSNGSTHTNRVGNRAAGE
jgi:hypothetical protein